ncbi:MAG: hypothetical protein LUE93_13560 [Bacteroides sp.]|nr:hypothetical protein [Bacteroides sp.]
MQEHPFTGTFSRKINFLLLFLTGLVIEVCFLVNYASLSGALSGVNAFLVVATWFTTAYLTWYQLTILRVWQSRIV